MFVVVTLLVGMFLPYMTFATATPGDVVINEFQLFGDYWVEFLNTTASDIYFASSTWQFTSNNMGPAGVSTTTISSGMIPANGIFTLSSSTLAGALPTSTEGTLLSLIDNGTTIYSMSYGSSTFAAEPHMTTSSMPATATSSAALLSSTWNSTSSITRGWFNTTPTVDSIIGTINSGGITTNWASSTDSSAITGLYFEKTGAGRLTFNSTLNLTNASTTALLQDLGNKMTSVAGSMKLDARTALDLKNAGATVAIYGLATNGYNSLSLSDITVKDDSGNTIATSSVDYPTLTTSSWSGAANNGTFTFTTSHFTEFQFNPKLTQVTAVTTPTSSTSPYYTFTSNATGTTSFVGACSAAATSTTINGTNTITVGPLTEGTYSNCYVKVVDLGGASSTLAMTAFTVDTTAPTNQDTVYPTSSRRYGGGSVTIVSSGDATNNVWFGPSTGTVNFVAGATTTKATSGTSTTILAPATAGTYKLFVLDAAGNKSASSTATLTVDNTSTTATLTPTAVDGPTIRSEKKAAGVPIVVGLGSSGAVATDTLELLLDGASWTTPKTRVLTAADISAGTYTFTVASGDGWGSDGTKLITARVTDEAGNVGAVSGALSLYLDTAYYPGGGGGGGGGGYTYVPPVTPTPTATTTTATSTIPVTQTPVTPTTPVVPTGSPQATALAAAQKTLQSLLLQLQVLILQAKVNGTPIPAGAEALLTQSLTQPTGISKTSQITRTLSLGVIGDDVKLLQQFLNRKGFTVTATGAGSPGYETTKFGFATRAALAKFQSANGITPASGLFGPKTRAYLESIGE